MAVNYALVPVPYMRPAVKAYIEQGRRPGAFLMALFSGQLLQTVCGADKDNYPVLREWVQFVHNEMPPDSHGSPIKVATWMTHKQAEVSLIVHRALG